MSIIDFVLGMSSDCESKEESPTFPTLVDQNLLKRLKIVENELKTCRKEVAQAIALDDPNSENKNNFRRTRTKSK